MRRWVFFKRHQFKVSENEEEFGMGFYDTYEEDGKETDLKGYLYTFCYAKKPYEIMEGTTDMILYNKRNTYSFSNHVVTAHKRIFHTFLITRMGDQRLWLGMIPPLLR